MGCTGICPVLGALALVFGAVLVRSAWKRAAPVLRLLRDARPVGTRDGGEFVRIEGRAETAAPLASPLGGTACVAWSLRVDRWVHGSRSSRRVTILSESRVAAFDVVDAAGRVRVEPEGAVSRFSPAPTATRTPERFADLPDTARAVLAARGLVLDAPIRRGSVIVEERVLPQGATCTILGSLRRTAAAGESYRDEGTAGILSAGPHGLHVWDGSAEAIRRSLHAGLALRALGPLGFLLLLAALPWLRHLGH